MIFKTMQINKVIIIGNLVRDVTLAALPTGNKVINFSLAVNRKYKDADGTAKESVEYVDMVAFGRHAELIAQYTKKGQSLYCEGRLQTRSWVKEDNTKAYKTEVVVETIQFGDKPRTTVVDIAKNDSNGEVNPDEIPF